MTGWPGSTSALEDRGCTVRGGEAQCPAHEDTRASLSVGQGRDGALVKCHAGCELDAVLEALGMSAAGLFDEPREPAESRGGAVVAATYTYTDEDGAPLFYAERLDPKGFRQYRIVAGVKVWKLGDVRKVPYRLPGLLTAAAAGGTVYVVEGEKDVHAIEAAGAVATCNPMGAGKWRAEYARYFTGAATVIIVADRDEAGRKHAAAAARLLRKAGVTVEIVEPAEGKDAADHRRRAWPRRFPRTRTGKSQHSWHTPSQDGAGRPGDDDAAGRSGLRQVAATTRTPCQPGCATPCTQPTSSSTATRCGCCWSAGPGGARPSGSRRWPSCRLW